MRKLSIFIVSLLLFSLTSGYSLALEIWEFKKSYESKNIVSKSFGLATTGDINGNGTNEIILTDFDQSWETNPSLGGFHLYIVEWQNDQLNINQHKKWDPSEHESKRFMAYTAKQLVSWKIDNRVTVEAMPPYFGIQWKKGKYVFHDEQVWERPKTVNTIGSWVLPWISPACYPGFSVSKGPQWKVKANPRECLVGIRDFSDDGNYKTLSILEEEIIKDKQYKQRLRVRGFKPGFQIEYEIQSPKRFVFSDSIDRLKQTSKSGVLLRVFRTTDWYFFYQDKKTKKFLLKPLPSVGTRGLEIFDLPDLYLRKTQKEDQEEYWGYRLGRASDKDDIKLLSKVDISQDYSSFTKVDVNFEHHEPFLGVSYFDVKDIDGDSIDEIIVMERTGKRKIGEDSTSYSDLKEYLHILKWNGEKYQTMWVSPPYSQKGTKFIVEDIKNSGKKQLVVLTPKGTIQIWERE